MYYKTIPVLSSTWIVGKRTAPNFWEKLATHKSRNFFILYLPPLILHNLPSLRPLLLFNQMGVVWKFKFWNSRRVMKRLQNKCWKCLPDDVSTKWMQSFEVKLFCNFLFLAKNLNQQIKWNIGRKWVNGVSPVVGKYCLREVFRTMSYIIDLTFIENS